MKKSIINKESSVKDSSIKWIKQEAAHQGDDKTDKQELLGNDKYKIIIRHKPSNQKSWKNN